MKTYREALDEMEANANYANPFLPKAVAYQRRLEHAVLFKLIQDQIEKLFYPQFISYPEDAEFIESLIRLTMSKRVLELGMFTGFTTLHMIRAVYPDGLVCCIDNQEVYPSFFKQPEIAKCFAFYHGDTLEALHRWSQLPNFPPYDLVFVDSDHSLEHTEKERQLLWNVTRPGSIFVFHDCPPQHQPHHAPNSGQLWTYLYQCVANGWFKGLILPSADRIDVKEIFGENYKRECLPHLGVFIRT